MRKDSDRQVNAIVDGQELKLGLPEYFDLKGDTNGGNEAFFASEKSGVGMQIPVPQGAQVREKGKIDGLTGELLTLPVKLGDIIKLAGAKSLVFQLGKSSPIAIGEVHMSRLREFVGAITTH